MEHPSFTCTVPLALVLLALGTGACGQAADADHADAAPIGGAATTEGPDRRGPTHLDLMPFAAAGQAGASGAETPPGTATPAAAAERDRAATRLADTTVPRIVSVQPSNAAVGVRADARIVIEFSEPMDQRATVDAFASETLRRAHTSMTWNEAGTVLTLEPESPLTYAHATLEDAEPLELRAETYGYTITRFATDLAGNALPEASVQFSTLREVTHTVNAVPALTGASRSLDPATQQPRLYGFVSFDASALPAGIVALEHAVVQLGRHSVDAPVPVFEVTFDELSAATSVVHTGGWIGTFPSGASGALAVPADARAFLTRAYLNRSDADHFAQVRLELPPSVAHLDPQLAIDALRQTSLVADYLLP